MRFQVVGLSTPSVLILCLKNPQMGDDTVYLQLLLTVGLVRWSKLHGCWQLKNKKNFPFTINNYLLKHNGVTIIYTIYSLREIVAFVVFEKQLTEAFGWCSFSILFNLWEREAFAGEISFLILLSLIWTLDLFSHVTLKTFIFIKDSPRNKHSQLANQSQIISYTFITF